VFDPSIREESAQEFSEQAVLQLVDTVLKKNALFRMRAHGWSMFPFIRDQDIVTIAPFIEPPKIGDIAVFKHPAYHCLAIHRIVGRYGDFYLLRGDNSRQYDGWLHSEKIFGKVSDLKRKNKKVNLGLGIERFMIAMLSRMEMLIEMRKSLLYFLRPFLKRRGVSISLKKSTRLL